MNKAAITLLLVTFALLTVGVIMLFSTSSLYARDRYGDAHYLLKRQLVWLALGGVACAVAASTPQSDSMRMAGARGFIPMSSSLLSRTYLNDHWKLVEDGAASAGREAKRSQWRIARDVLVGPSPAVARERARTVLGRNYEQHQLPNRVGTIQMTSTKLTPSMADEAVTVDYLMENVWIVGDPSECAEKIHQLHEESGGFGTLLTITTDSDDAGWDHESLRLLMEQVAPRVAHLG